MYTEAMTASKHRIHFLLQSTANNLKHKSDRVFQKAAGLTFAQAVVLKSVQHRKNVTQRQLAEQLRLNEPATTAMITRLQEAKLLERSRDTEDRRVRVLSLTKNGQQALVKVQDSFKKVNAKLDWAMADTDTSPAELARLLEAITDSEL